MKTSIFTNDPFYLINNELTVTINFAIRRPHKYNNLNQTFFFALKEIK